MGTGIAWLSQAGLSVIDVRREGPAVPSNMVTLRAVNREMKKIREQKWEKNSMITAWGLPNTKQYLWNAFPGKTALLSDSQMPNNKYATTVLT